MIVNACDAGREGELIFAYVYETAKVKKPVQRLWLNSMTQARRSRRRSSSLRPGEEMEPLEAAARSRSEADWLVGMNATRAASIRLRAAFDGAVSLGRVQTPTLALVVTPRGGDPRLQARALLARGGASSRPTSERRYAGRYLGGKRIAEDEAATIVARSQGQPGEITKLEKKEEREQPAAPLRPHLAPAPREHAATASRARRTLAAAQRLYEEHKAITYPRTNSRYLTGDMVAEIKPTAELVGPQRRSTRKGAEYVTCAREAAARPRGQRREGRRTTTRSSRRAPSTTSSKMGADELKIYDLVAKRFLAIFHPEAVFERTRVETTVREHVFRTSGRRAARGRAGRPSTARRSTGSDRPRTTPAATSCCPSSSRARTVQTREVESLRKETQPPRRFTDASLLGAMETAGKEIEDAELREAMKDSGIGTPATRASIIERLIDVGYIEREGRALRGHREGHPGDPAARRARAHLARAHRRAGSTGSG